MRSLIVVFLMLGTSTAVADNNLQTRMKAQRAWLESQVIAKTKNKKLAAQLRAQLARMSPKQLERAVKVQQASYERQKAIADRLAQQTGNGRKRAQSKSRGAAAARRARLQANRNHPPGFQPVIRNIPGGRQQPPNPRRGINLPPVPTPQFGFGPISFAFKTIPGRRSAPTWYRKIRSR